MVNIIYSAIKKFLLLVVMLFPVASTKQYVRAQALVKATNVLKSSVGVKVSFELSR